MSLEPGTNLGPYEIVSRLGSGAMGVVYRASDPRLKRTVAIKVLPPDLTSDRTAQQRFLQEAQAASALEHPNICTIHDVGETDDGGLYLVMAHYEGETLQDRLAGGALAPREAVDIVSQVAQGLAAAHAAGIVHRDIKPANLFVTTSGAVKILDFGLAKLAGTDSVTEAGTAVGTVAYMSPEQARGQPVDHRSDIWALGAVAYEMLAGQAPFQGENLLSLAEAIRSREPPPLTGEASSMNGVVRRAISKDPSRRFQSATEFSEALRSRGSSVSVNVPADAEGASIAVLPFANMSPEKEQARTSSFAFKGRDVDVREIAAALGVAAILEGSVRKAGDRLRVTAQLVNAADGYHLWSERFDRQLEDVFAVQDEITLAIVEALRVRLLGGERDRLLKRSTENQEAFTLYLKARHHLHTFTTAGLRQAERFSRHAIALDSNYAKAWVSLGAALLFRGGTAPTDDVPPREVYPEARDAINRALQLDGQLAEAHMMLGVLRTWFERDWEGARRAFADALTLKPNDSDVHFWYGQHFWISNRLDDAMHHARIAAAKDPLAIVFPSFVGHVNQCLRRYDEAIAQFEQVLEMEPRFFHALLHLGDVYATTGDYVRAEQCYQRAQDVVGEDSSYLAARQIALATDVGRHEEARTRLEALLERATRRYTPHGFIAIAYLGLGDHDAVFEWLDKAVDEGTGLVCVWATMPWSDPVRSDPRFADLLRRLDLPRSAEG